MNRPFLAASLQETQPRLSGAGCEGWMNWSSWHDTSYIGVAMRTLNYFRILTATQGRRIDSVTQSELSVKRIASQIKKIISLLSHFFHIDLRGYFRYTTVHYAKKITQNPLACPSP